MSKPKLSGEFKEDGFTGPAPFVKVKAPEEPLEGDVDEMRLVVVLLSQEEDIFELEILEMVTVSSLEIADVRLSSMTPRTVDDATDVSPPGRTDTDVPESELSV